MNLDFMMVIGGLFLLVFFFVIALCLSSSRKSPYDKKIEDDEQMRYVSEYNKRKGSKK
jgi:preprotein translocase subunit SecG